MPSPAVTPSTDNREWAQAQGKAQETLSSVGEMASHAASAVGEMAGKAAADVGTLASQAACDVGKRADDLTANAGAGIRGFGDTIAKNLPNSGIVGSASQSVAKTVHDGGEYLEHAKLSGMTEDLVQLIKRNPIPAVCIALGLGWFLASRTRS